MRLRLVQLGCEWGRTADELEDVLTLDGLFEVMAGYAIQSEEFEKKRQEAKRG